MTASAPDWAALFLPEFDAYSRECEPPESHHFLYRHYPGEGSWAMAWAIRNDFHDHLQHIEWRGILEVPRSRKHGHSASLYIIGVHGSHGDALKDSLTDVVALVKRKPRHVHSSSWATGMWIYCLPCLQTHGRKQLTEGCAI